MNDSERKARALLEAAVAELEPLETTCALAGWAAATTGTDEAIRRAAETRTALGQAYSNPERLHAVRRILTSDVVIDPIVRRQLVLLDHLCTPYRLPADSIADIAAREAELERVFYNFRGEVDGAPRSNNELQELLVSEQDNDRRRRIWEASKVIGPSLAPGLLELVRRRNAAARALGFANHYSMGLSLQEIDEGELFQLLHEFELRTEPAFRGLRKRIDSVLADRFAVAPLDLRPWHWGDFFGQEVPPTGEVDLDPIYGRHDPVSLARDYFTELGLPVEGVLDRSDLYERAGKDQSAFCTDIDRKGDVRILCNLRSDERWTRTLLHELGHAVYDENIPRDLPYLLRTPAHTLSTEAIAMFFGRLTRDPEWVRRRVDPSFPAGLSHAVRQQQRSSMLISTRWMLVMIHFERAIYRDPDRKDLNLLWWNLVERFQSIHSPEGRDEPDWATKFHLSLRPVYYQNYLLGELMASQIGAAVNRSSLRERGMGEFLRERIFARGATLPWNDLLRDATGERLTPTYFVEDFVNGPAFT